MAKAKVLEDKVVISSEVLTDENLAKVSILNPSVLSLRDEEGNSLYQVATSEINSFTRNGASFKGGKTSATVCVNEDDDTKRKEILTAEITKNLVSINKIEEQVKAYLEDAEDIEVDIDFLED